MRKYTRKEFIKTSSMGAAAASMLAGTPLKLLAGTGKLTRARLGNTGIEMSKLGVGAPRIQEPSVLKYALDSGISFIDTGRAYGNGKNEEMIGEVIKGRRKEMVIQSKVKIDPGKETSDNETLSVKIKEQFNTSLEESLKALQTDYIDVMLYHGADDTEWIYKEAVMEPFAKAKKEGKILAAGFSNHINQIEILQHHNADPFYDVIMLAFNPHGGYEKKGVRNLKWDQQALISQLEKASDYGTGIVAMKTCLGGPYCCEGDTEKTFPGAVKWIIKQPYIHTTAVAMANFQQLDEHLAMHKSP